MTRRFPKYLSPTSFGKYKSNKREYYMQYRAPVKPPGIPQTAPMAVGSAFDAHVKSDLYHRLFGKNDPRFELTNLFEAQVEPHNRDEGMLAGKHVYDEYTQLGCLADLFLDLSKSPTAPRFETSVELVVDGVPLSGKPDLSFANSEGAVIVLDWKVNGYYSQASPAKGYLRLRERGCLSGAHKESLRVVYKGVPINCAHTLDLIKDDWSTQLSIYSWCLGQSIGGDTIFAIDQVVGKQNGNRPYLKIAEHRCKISPVYQARVHRELKEAWEIITSDHFFRDMSKEASEELCATLDKTALALAGPQSVNDKWLSEVARSA